jgi:hypothetical protein
MKKVVICPLAEISLNVAKVKTQVNQTGKMPPDFLVFVEHVEWAFWRVHQVSNQLVGSSQITDLAPAISQNDLVRLAILPPVFDS